jgi:hypothetical protein
MGIICKNTKSLCENDSFSFRFFSIISSYISETLCLCGEILDINNLKEERFILLTAPVGSAHGCLPSHAWGEHHGDGSL